MFSITSSSGNTIVNNMNRHCYMYIPTSIYEEHRVYGVEALYYIILYRMKWRKC